MLRTAFGRTAFVALLGLMALACRPAAAVTCTWLIDGAGAWGNPGNWSACGTGNGTPAGTPGPADIAVFSNATPLAAADLGADRTVAGLDLQAGRVTGNFNLTIATFFNWSGGTLEGVSAASDQLFLLPSASGNLSGGLHTLRSRRWVIQGSTSWTGGDLRLEADAEVDSQATLTAAPTVGVQLKIESDNSPLARFHNNSGGGVFTLNGQGGVALKANVIFDNGNAVNANLGTLRIESPGSDFGSYTIGSAGVLEFAPQGTRNLTGSPALAGPGLLRKVGPGALIVIGDYTHVGPLRIFDGILDLSTPAASLSFADVALQAPGVWTGSDDFVVNLLNWNGGDISAPAGGPQLTIPAIGTATMLLDDPHPGAGLGARTLINQGSFTINSTDAVAFKTFSLGVGADIDNQGNFDISANNASDFFLTCAGPGSRVDNRSGASWRMQHLGSGQVEIVPCLDAFDNAGILRTDAGITHLRAAGTDSGTLDVNGSSRLWLADSSPTLRILGPSATVNVAATARIELWGRLQADGASRVLHNFDIRPSGVLYGPAAITLTGNPKWMGTLEGVSTVETVTVPAGSTLANDFVLGGDFNLVARRLIVDGQLDVTLHSLRLGSGADIQVNGLLSMNSSPAGSAAIACFNPACGSLLNSGALTSNASGLPSLITEDVNYAGTGSITVNGGRLVVQAGGSFAGSYTATGSNELEFARSARSFPSGSSFAPASRLFFGDISGTTGVNTIDGCFGAGSQVVILDAFVEVNCGAPTSFAQLTIGRPSAVLAGSSLFSVTSGLNWSAGSIVGSGSEIFQLANGASGSFTLPGAPAGRRLSARQFINHGTITWTGGNATSIDDGAVFDNAADGTILINPGAATNADWLSNGLGSPQLINRGLLHVVAANENFVDVPFDNLGTFRVTNAFAYLFKPGNDTGAMLLDAATAQVAVDTPAAVRTLGAAGSINGTGRLVVSNSASLHVNGALSLTRVDLFANGTLAVDSPSTATVNQLVLGGGTLTGATQLDVLASLNWDSGTVTGTGSPNPLRLAPGSSSTIVGTGAKSLSARTLRISGALSWLEGEVTVPTAASGLVDVVAGGTLDFNVASGPAGLRCNPAPCTLGLQSAGSVLQQGPVRPNLQLSSDMLVSGGSLQVSSGGLQVNAILQSGGFTNLLSGAQLQTSTLTLSGGELRGAGEVTGSVVNNGGFVRPGASPGNLIAGSFTQGPGGTLVLEVSGNIPGTGHDHLTVGSGATLDGTLLVSDLGYTPVSPEVLSLIDAGTSVTGTFANVNQPYPSYQLTYTANAVRLEPLGGPLVVNSTADPGTGGCDVAECTLREAILEANLSPDPDVIQFQLAAPGVVATIAPATPLPVITTPLQIDGYSEPGASANTQAPGLGLGSNAVVLVELDGSAAGGDGLVINAPSFSLVEIRGLALFGWNNAIHVQGPGNSAQVILGNFVGLRANGSAGAAQATGVAVFGGSPMIGDASAAGMNVIGGNNAGIHIGSLAPTSGARITGNLVGTSPNGLAARANQTGIRLLTASTLPGIQIGGAMPDERNVISGNLSDGVFLDCSATGGSCFDGAAISANYIGVAADGSTPLGNGRDGIRIGQMDVGQLFIGGICSLHPSPDVPQALVDVGTATSTVAVADTDPILDLDVQIQVTHTFDNDLQVRLVPPGGGAPIALVSNRGGSGNDFAGTVFDDEAPQAIASGTPPFAGRFRPESPLFAVDGLAPTGTWTLEVQDISTGETGTLDAWALQICTEPQTGAGANRIAHNAGSGLRAAHGGTGRVTVLRNEFFGNGGLGIDLNGDGRTANDAGDADIGPNGLLNFPSFTSYSAPGGSAAVIDVLLDTPDIGGNYPAHVDFYKAIEDEPGVWLGSTTCATPNTSCPASFNFPGGVTVAPDDVVLGVVRDGFGKSSEASFYPSTTTITGDAPDPSTIGTPYTVNVQLTSPAPFNITGSVDIADGAGGVCSALLAPTGPGNSTGSCMLPSAMPAGARTLTANYLPENAPRRPFSNSGDTEAHTVDSGVIATSTSIASVVPASVVTGQPYAVTVSVVDSLGGMPVGAGTVQVRQLSDNSSCSIDLATASSCNLVSPVALNTAVRATYLGSGSLQSSTSPIQTVSVQRANTTLSIDAHTPNPSLAGQPIAVSASLAVQAPGAGSPSGDVLVTDGVGSCLYTLPATGCTLVPKTVGAVTLQVRYLGDANFNATVATVAHTINANGADLSIVKFNGRRLLPGGQPSQYTLLVSNAGPNGVVDARVVDLLPPQLGSPSWTCSAGAGASCPPSGTGTVDALVSLQSGSSLTFTLTTTAQAQPEQVVTNTATVTPPVNADDPDPSDNQSSDSDATGLFGDGFESEQE